MTTDNQIKTPYDEDLEHFRQLSNDHRHDTGYVNAWETRSDKREGYLRRDTELRPAIMQLLEAARQTSLAIDYGGESIYDMPAAHLLHQQSQAARVLEDAIHAMEQALGEER